MLKELIEQSKTIYEDSEQSLISYYNKPYNYNKLVSLLNSSFGNLMDVSFISKVFEAKRALHNLEKTFTLNNIKLEMSNSQAVIAEYKLTKKYRQEAISRGMETEAAIRAHIDFKLTEFNSQYEEFSSYREATNQVREFLNKENRNVESLLSQGKSLSYSGHKFSDDVSLFGYGEED